MHIFHVWYHRPFRDCNFNVATLIPISEVLTAVIHLALFVTGVGVGGVKGVAIKERRSTDTDLLIQRLFPYNVTTSVPSRNRFGS